MINEIINAIGARLSEVFGEGYEIYADNVDQGLTEPCFLISALLSQKTNLLGNRSKTDRSFMLQYFPSGELRRQNECREVGDRLLDTMEYITVCSVLCRCTAMQYEIVDDVLQFQFSCNTLYAERVEKERMKEMELSQTTKG